MDPVKVTSSHCYDKKNIQAGRFTELDFEEQKLSRAFSHGDVNIWDSASSNFLLLWHEEM